MTDPIDDAIAQKRKQILDEDRGITDGEGLILTTEDALDGPSDDSPKSCMECVHRDVCAILNRFGAVLGESVNGENLPMEPTELAEICDEYHPE